MTNRTISAEEFDRRFDDGESVIEFLDLNKITKAAPTTTRRVNLDIPIDMIADLDKQARKRGVPITWTGFTYVDSAPQRTQRWIDVATELAARGLDLVEISPNSEPPVCKILDYGKYKYQAQKKAAEARKKQRTVEIKEIKMRPNIDIHDYAVKMRSINRFFEEGDKVKVTLRFRGREMAHMELGTKLLDRVKLDTSTIAKVESEPRLEGRQMVMVLSPR